MLKLKLKLLAIASILRLEVAGKPQQTVVMVCKGETED